MSSKPLRNTIQYNLVLLCLLSLFEIPSNIKHQVLLPLLGTQVRTECFCEYWASCESCKSCKPGSVASHKTLRVLWSMWILQVLQVLQALGVGAVILRVMRVMLVLEALRVL